MIHLTILFRRPKSPATRPLSGGSDPRNIGTATGFHLSSSGAFAKIALVWKLGFQGGKRFLQCILQSPVIPALSNPTHMQRCTSQFSTPIIAKYRAEGKNQTSDLPACLPTKPPSRPSRRLHFVKQLEVGAPTESERKAPPRKDRMDQEGR